MVNDHLEESSQYNYSSPPDKNHLGELLGLPMVLSFAIWGYFTLAAFITKNNSIVSIRDYLAETWNLRTLGIVMQFFIPFSYCLLFSFVLSVAIWRFAVLRYLVVKFRTKTMVFVPVFLTWYIFASLFLPMRQTINSLIRQSFYLSNHLVFVALILNTLISILIFMRMYGIVLNLGDTQKVAQEDDIGRMNKTLFYLSISVLTLILAL